MNTVGEVPNPLTESAAGAVLLEWVSIYLSHIAMNTSSTYILLLILCSVDQRAATFPKSFHDR